MKFKNKVTSLISALTLGLTSCPAAYVKTPTGISEEVEDNKRIQRDDLVAKIESFSPTIHSEFAAGKINAFHKTVDHPLLDAHYLPKTEYNIPSIIIECKPDFSQCENEGVYNSLGHHVFAQMSDLEKDKFKQVIAKRLTQADAKDFSLKSTFMRKELDKVNQILTEGYLTKLYCDGLVADTLHFREITKLYLSLTVDLNLLPEGKKLAILAKSLDQYSKQFISCNPENLFQAAAKEKALETEFVTTLKNIQKLYLNETIEPVEESSFESLNYPLKINNLDQMKLAREEYLISVQETFTEMRASLGSLPSNQLAKKLDQDLNVIETKILDYHKIITELAANIVKSVNHLNLTFDRHNQAEELFSGAVVSLCTTYKDNFRLGPLKFKLDGSMLGFFSEFKYQNELIFKEEVDKYRK